MSKGVTPHNYNLRNRFGPELLRSSDFTPPSFVSTPRATAPPHSDELATIPTTSLLLETAALYTSPVTIYPPFTTLQTTPTSATGIITTPSPAPVILPLSDLGSTDLTPPTSFLPLPTQRTPDLTTFERPYQQESPLGPFLPVLVTPKSTFFETNRQNSVPEHRTLPEHLSGTNIHPAHNRFSQTVSSPPQSNRLKFKKLGINVTVSEFTGISWDQAWEECFMRNVRLPNASLDLTVEPLPEGYNTTPVWVDVSYVNKTQSVSSLQETSQKIFKCMAVSNKDGEFLYRLDNCSALNRFLCGNPPTAELYPSNLYSWIGAQKQCRLQHNQISNMAKPEAETNMERGAWYWVFDVRKMTFHPDHALEKDGCGYVQDGKLKFTNCSDRVPTTLCIGEPIDRVRQEDNYSEDSDDLKVILIAVFVSLGFGCSIIVAVISFIKRKRKRNKSKKKFVTVPKRKLEHNVLNIQTNTATSNDRTGLSASISQPANYIVIPEQNGRKTMLVTSSASENHRHNNGQNSNFKIDYNDIISYLPRGNDNSVESSVVTIVNDPVEYEMPKQGTRNRTVVKMLPFEDSGVHEEYKNSLTFKHAIPMEGSYTKSRHVKANLPSLEYEHYDTNYDVRRHRVLPHYESFV